MPVSWRKFSFADIPVPRGQGITDAGGGCSCGLGHHIAYTHIFRAVRGVNKGHVAENHTGHRTSSEWSAPI